MFIKIKNLSWVNMNYVDSIINKEGKYFFCLNGSDSFQAEVHSDDISRLLEYIEKSRK